MSDLTENQKDSYKRSQCAALARISSYIYDKFNVPSFRIDEEDMEELQGYIIVLQKIKDDIAKEL